MKLEFIIEQSGFNNSLIASNVCNNSNGPVSSTGGTAQSGYVATYLANATQRFKSMAGGFNWTVQDTYAAQELCPYETVGLGYSQFCDLFTYQEYEGLSYSLDLEFAGNNLFQSPTGRAVGIGYVQELLGVSLNLEVATSATILMASRGSSNITLLRQTPRTMYAHQVILSRWFKLRSI